ncbi:hypothetical protein EVG20_g3443 [Dentipellis fragilis]|uniref:Uncharacterized protein n=1 Tax=Dentipellis fragilis TaxID=205917 RepID=A0A4Y9Z3U4_9AGAM|nr:hypothetical protein EVG20_g3443 [Dentipellis fragilis]
MKSDCLFLEVGRTQRIARQHETSLTQHFAIEAPTQPSRLPTAVSDCYLGRGAKFVLYPKGRATAASRPAAMPPRILFAGRPAHALRNGGPGGPPAKRSAEDETAWKFQVGLNRRAKNVRGCGAMTRCAHDSEDEGRAACVRVIVSTKSRSPPRLERVSSYRRTLTGLLKRTSPPPYPGRVCSAVRNPNDMASSAVLLAPSSI